MNRIELDIGHADLKIHYISLKNDFAPLDFKYLLADDITHMSDKRLKDYILGRLCAQFDLKSPFKISKDPKSGRPIFPKGFCGSISHSKDFAIAAVARTYDYKSIGIDLERIVNQKRVDVISKMTLTKSEKQLLSESSDKFLTSTILFSAKESLYKMINPITNEFINFHEGIIREIDLIKNEYQIELRSQSEKTKEFNDVYSGKFFRLDENIGTICCLLTRMQ